MKKIITLLLALTLLSACLVSCGDSKKTVEDLKKTGKLVIATSPDFPPFEELKSNGSVEGIEIDVLNLICEKLGVTLKIEQMDFDSVIPGIQAKKYDLGASGITVTESRKKNVLFTVPYCLAAQAIVVKADSKITGKDDLVGKTIAVQTATTAESFCLECGYTVNSYAANNDAESALLTGKADAWVIDDLTAADMVKAYNAENGEKLVILDEAMTTEPYAFALPFGSEEIVDAFNEILSGMLADGTIEKIFAKYGAPYTAPSAQ